MTDKAKVRVVILDLAEKDLIELRAYVIKNFSLKMWQSTFAETKETI
jgi:hypothetical protein